MRPRPVVGKATVPDAVRRLLDKFDYPDQEAPQQLVPILPTLGASGDRVLIESGGLSSADKIEITGIPGQFSDLLLQIEARAVTSGIAGDSIRLRLGGSGGLDVTTTTYSYAFTEHGSATNNVFGTDVPAIGPTSGFGSPFTADNADAGHLGWVTIHVYQYVDPTNFRHVSMTGGRYASSTNFRLFEAHGLWHNQTDPITQLEVRPGGDTDFVAGARWWLYGV